MYYPFLLRGLFVRAAHGSPDLIAKQSGANAYSKCTSNSGINFSQLICKIARPHIPKSNHKYRLSPFSTIYSQSKQVHKCIISVCIQFHQGTASEPIIIHTIRQFLS